jgi:hypothetical protein
VSERLAADAAVDPDLLRARTLHPAEGILIALQRRPAEQVIPEMVEVARDSGPSPFAIAEIGGGRKSTMPLRGG